MIEFFKTFLSQIDNLNEGLELTEKTRQEPQTEKPSEEMIDVFNMIDKVGELMHKQLVKALEIEGELEMLAFVSNNRQEEKKPVIPKVQQP